MKQKQTVTILITTIVLLSGVATVTGIFSSGGVGNYTYETIRQKTVTIYGKGIYKHMSADLAIQGIAQDIITLCIGIPLLLIALWGFRKGSVKSRFLLAGATGYFFVTYLFYSAMAMYNELFLVYVTLLALSFFSLFNLLTSFKPETVSEYFSTKTPANFTGGFLIFNAVAIALMWLGRVVPPLLDGTIYPNDLQHYTTLIVQGFDLGLLLPISFISGLLLKRKNPMGYLTGVPYVIFLSILMTSLSAKIIAMGINGVNIIPAVFIIPAINLVTITCAVMMLRSIK
ncbi:hypothetical protein D1164_11295 [Mariniphaga sediminis]|jgi:hypothetical protein|uniref:Uncharacterized protein n=1 Tax=Mariniphaga sediminis TaxID=1628158 RepID=A0A399D153_9BACT|nr:hypothetical protein [Mariniphaga sediminis]RIH65163.1 hypothetical protein D1164_11295 [Mariniphaga sediminis]